MTSAAPLRMEYDPFSPAFQADPFPVYGWMRDEAPVFYSEKWNWWALSRIHRYTGKGSAWNTGLNGSYSIRNGAVLVMTSSDGSFQQRRGFGTQLRMSRHAVS